MKKILSLIVTAAIINIAICISTLAEDGPLVNDTVFQVAIEDFLTLTLDDTDSIAHLSPSSTLSSGIIKATVSTNNPVGYTLTMKDADDSNELERSGYTAFSKKDPTFYRIPSITEDVSRDALTEDTWGYSLNDDQSYHPVPLAEVEISSSNAPITSDTTDINFGIKISPTRPTGAYKDTISFIAVANIASVSLEQSYAMAGKSRVEIDGSEYYLMQDMTTDVCAAVTDIPSELMVADARDNKRYWIAKLADGHCWMTQNLDFDIPATALSSDTTDLTEYGVNGYTEQYGYTESDGVIEWTPARETIPASGIDSSGSASSWASNNNSPYSIDTGDWYWDSGSTPTAPRNYLVNELGDPPVFSQSAFSDNGKHGQVGNLYNWPAAIASNNSTSYNTSTYNDISNNPHNSVCPAGWRLPTISSASSSVANSTNEYYRLFGLYKTTDGHSSYYRPFTNPLWFVMNGCFYSKKLYSSNNGAYYWSSTVYSSNNNYTQAYAFSISYSAYGGISGSGSSASYSDRNRGYSIRCIAR